MHFRNQSNSLELVELVKIFSTIYILEGVDKDKAVGKKPLSISLLIETSMTFFRQGCEDIWLHGYQ